MNNPILEEIKREFRQGTVLTKLIIINIGVFLLINIVDLIFFLFRIPEFNSLCGNPVSFLSYWISVPANLFQLALKPWTIITYMFVHEGLMHILLNMLVFYFSGKIFLLYLSEKKLLTTYLIGGFAGAALFIFSYNIFPIFQGSIDCALCLGASASVMAVIIAIATYVPEYSVNLVLLGPVRLKYIAIVYVLIDIISIKSSNAGGHIAHLGGALWGYFYIVRFKKGQDLSEFFERTIDFISGVFKKNPKIKIVHKGNPDQRYSEEKISRQKKLDLILDKISKSGYESLSREEKDFLFKTSNNKF